MHVFGPFSRYPLAENRAYNVAEAPLEAHEQMKRRVGLERTVLVQASGYGTDNRAMLAALAALGERGRAVAVIEPDTSGAELDALHAAGVRGIRLNFQTLRDRYAGELVQWLERFWSRVAPLGWHLQLFASGDQLRALEPAIAAAPLSVVIDHMGLPDAPLGIGQPGFQCLLRLLSRSHVWAKLAGADRITRATGNPLDAIPFMRELAQCAPDRLVWGSDWPNIGFHAGQRTSTSDLLPYRNVDAGAMLDVLFEAIPDRDVRVRILVSNPERLYGFAAAPTPA